VSGVDASIAEGNGGALVARLAEVWADADAARMAELDRLIAEGGHERERRVCPCGCLAPLGECAEKEKLRVVQVVEPAPQRIRARVDEPRAPRPDVVHRAAQTSAPSTSTPAPTAPAQPAAPTETTMSCPECKSPSRHRSDCSRNPEKAATPTKTAPTPKAAKPPPSKPAPKSPAVRVASKRGPFDLEDLGVPELLDLRRAVDAEIRGRLETLEAQRAALLEAVSADAQLLERGKAA
jgi:hypothetical protein